MNNVVYIPQYRKQDISKYKKQKMEAEKMKKNKVVDFSKIAKINILRGSSSFLAALAIFFASAACSGHLYEAEVPEKLR